MSGFTKFGHIILVIFFDALLKGAEVDSALVVILLKFLLRTPKKYANV